MDEIETYRDEHRRLEAMISDFEWLLALERPPEPVSFLRFRHEFGRLLTQHLNREDWLIYPRLQASPVPALRIVADRFASGIGAFGASFASHVRHWTSGRIAGEWLSYRRATAALLNALRQRIDLEETELYPLLATVTATDPVAVGAARSRQQVSPR